MADIEDDTGGRRAVAGREAVDRLASPVDLPGQRVAGGAVAHAVHGGWRGSGLLPDLHFDGIAEWLDLSKPLSGLPAIWRGHRDRLTPSAHGRRTSMGGDNEAAERHIPP